MIAVTPEAATTETYFTHAIGAALREALEEDETVIVLGEDIELSVMGTTKGLAERFGRSRVRSTPISEATVVGACVGAAAAGLRPVMDLMYSSFLYLSMDQVANQAGRLRYMSGGQIDLPLVYIAATGPAQSAAAQHSENPHSILMHTTGLKVVLPSTPADAKGLLASSIRDPNPVVYLMDQVLFGQKGDVPTQPYTIPLGVGDIKRAGSDLTIVALGSMVGQSLEVAAQLESEGVSAEIVDPRSLVPFDWDLVFTSVRKTGRLIVVDPARRTCGAAAEISARVIEECWADLKSAPRRVTWEDVPMPFSPPLEEAVTVSAADITAAVRTVLAGSASPKPA